MQLAHLVFLRTHPHRKFKAHRNNLQDKIAVLNKQALVLGNLALAKCSKENNFKSQINICAMPTTLCTNENQTRRLIRANQKERNIGIYFTQLNFVLFIKHQNNSDLLKALFRDQGFYTQEQAVTLLSMLYIT